MNDHWYALRCKSRKEDSVWRQLVAQGFVGFYPRLRVNPVNPRSRKFKPYFPGYMFVLTNLESVGSTTFQWMPHTMGLVSFGGEPAFVPENLIDAIRKKVEQINASGGLVLEGLNKGEVILINEGPFKGYDAIFDAALPGAERVRVLIELLGSKRQVPLELNTGHIDRKRVRFHRTG